MTVSSRTPEGDPNRCPICGQPCRMEPSFAFADAPCPSCGYLLRFPAKGDERKPAAYLWRWEFRLGPPFLAWIVEVSNRLGCPTPMVYEFLQRIATEGDADRLKRLSHDAGNWEELIALWERQDVA